MPLIKADFTDADAMATAHAAHHNALAESINVGYAPPQLYAANRWFDQRVTSVATTTSALGADYITFVPTYIYRPTTITALGFHISTTGQTGATARLGIYTINPETLTPETLLVDAGTATTTTTGLKTLVISQGVERGWYWFAVATNTSTGAGTFMSASTGTAILSGGTTYSQPLTYLRLASTDGVLMTNPPNATSSYINGYASQIHPLIFFRT